MADIDMISKAEVLDIYAELYDEFDGAPDVIKVLNKVYDKLERLQSQEPVIFPTANGWISVKDRLPEKEGKYLVFTSGIFKIKIAMFTLSLKRQFSYTFKDGEPDRSGFYDWDSEDDWIQDDVTYWMHLPALPKEETK